LWQERGAGHAGRREVTDCLNGFRPWQACLHSELCTNASCGLFLRSLRSPRQQKLRSFCTWLPTAWTTVPERWRSLLRPSTPEGARAEKGWGSGDGLVRGRHLQIQQASHLPSHRFGNCNSARHVPCVPRARGPLQRRAAGRELARGDRSHRTSAPAGGVPETRCRRRPRGTGHQRLRQADPTRVRHWQPAGRGRAVLERCAHDPGPLAQRGLSLGHQPRRHSTCHRRYRSHCPLGR
jgi:hypothetical protein